MFLHIEQQSTQGHSPSHPVTTSLYSLTSHLESIAAERAVPRTKDAHRRIRAMTESSGRRVLGGTGLGTIQKMTDPAEGANGFKMRFLSGADFNAVWSGRIGAMILIFKE